MNNSLKNKILLIILIIIGILVFSSSLILLFENSKRGPLEPSNVEENQNKKEEQIEDVEENKNKKEEQIEDIEEKEEPKEEQNEKQETNENQNTIKEEPLNQEKTIENKEVLVESIELSNSNITVGTGTGAKGTLTARIIPSDAKDKEIVWKSSDTSIATVDEFGVVKGIRSGTVTITASTSNGVKSQATVNVESTDKIHFISHGEAEDKDHITGDAILLESNGSYAMIDMGNTDSKVVKRITNYLKEINVKKLDFVLFTHMDSDHAANLQNILESGVIISNIWIKNYDVESYRKNYIPNLNSQGIDIGIGPQNSSFDTYSLNVALARYKRIRYLAENSKYKDAVTKVRIISSSEEGTKYTYKYLKFSMTLYNNTRNVNAIQSENYNSIISLIEINGIKVLLTGDAYDTKQFNSIASTVGKIDIFKLPHHGSRMCSLLPKKYNGDLVDSTGETVNSTALNSLNPAYFVITSSRKKLANIRNEYNVAANKMCNDMIESYPDSNKYYVDETEKALVINLTNKITIEEK